MQHVSSVPAVRISFAASLLASVLASACAAGTATGIGGGGSGGAGSGTAQGASGSGFGTGASVGSGGGATVIYAHTNKTLFQVDPANPNAPPTTIGDFDCIGGSGQDTSMTDVAVNAEGDLWGVTERAIIHLAIQGNVVHCVTRTPIVSSNQVKFFGLTFAPAGVLDPAKEVLVAGNTAGELWAIDDNGNLTQHGTLGVVPANDGNGHTYSKSHQGQAWELSGDIVFLANGGAPIGFATVRDCPSPPSTSNCNGTDTLVEIDVTKLGSATTQSVLQSVRGEVVKRSGCADAGNASGYGSMYGIAAVGTKVLGFSHAGPIVEIDNTNGSACLLVDTQADAWDGAGVTTTVAVVAPPPK